MEVAFKPRDTIESCIIKMEVRVIDYIEETDYSDEQILYTLSDIVVERDDDSIVEDLTHDNLVDMLGREDLISLKYEIIEAYLYD